MSAINTNKETTLALQIVIPVIYIVLAIIGIIGNVIVLQIICANRFRHKSINMIVFCILFDEIFYIVIFKFFSVFAHIDCKIFIVHT